MCDVSPQRLVDTLTGRSRIVRARSALQHSLPAPAWDPFEIDAAIGAGGMGEVYRASDTRLNHRRVAIKVLTDESSASTTRRFQRDATTASALNHPNIVTVHEIGELDGRPYLVTEFVDGGTLADWADGGTRSWREIVEILTMRIFLQKGSPQTRISDDS